MAIPEASTDGTQNEGESPDNSDKPAHIVNQFQNKLSLAKSNGMDGPRPNGNPINQDPNANFPLPPPDSLMTGTKQPGLTRAALEKLAAVQLDSAVSTSSSSDQNHTNGKPSSHKSSPMKLSISPATAVENPSGFPSPTPASPTDSYWDASAPPSRAPSRPGSRAPSMSAGFSGGKILGWTAPTASRERRGSKPETPAPARKPASVHSDKGEGHKFNLKDLLGGGTKLNRKSSQRSTSSRRSDSDAGDGRAKSTGGESAVSLTQKYGVCQKVAIGKGATSVVRLAHKWDRSEEKLYAIKEFRKRRKNESEKEYVKKLTSEFCISSTLHHPNVVETVDLIQDENLHWCEVMEFCPGGDLYAAIKRGGMSPSEVECCFKQLLNGVKYLHGQGVAHRDLKPENLFFDAKGYLKIGDYGASTVYRLPWETTVHMSSGLCGSEPYIAPEQFMGKRKLCLLIPWFVAASLT
ncbi:other/HAL protein kinase [Coprinopsis cinerea AmutBmut pab1-1]|nr:other/HAL protein kinase [Coprinopsis cinerea AmutBmut pab1-1]